MLPQENRLESIERLLGKSERAIRHESYIDCRTEKPSAYQHTETKATTSSHNYPPELKELIRCQANGWVLDCGSGSREREYSNVVNFEIEPFKGVDVVGLAEELPFLDATFDLVISLAVLEHVRDPFLATREMQRVLKPGGKLWIDVAFMQPYHGYPAHYYNMTQQGLENLLGPDMNLLRNEVPRYGTPIWSLTWIIGRYANSLPPQTREHFLSLPISELLKSPESLCEEEFSTLLSEEARKEMAATVSILAEKL